MSEILSPSPHIHPSHRPLQEVKPVTISKIELTENELLKLKAVLNSERMGAMSKDVHQRRLIGQCICCNNIPEFIVTKYYQDVKLIERYCKDCLSKEKQKGSFDFK